MKNPSQSLPPPMIRPPIAITDNKPKPITTDKTVPIAVTNEAPIPDSLQAAETPILAADNATNPLDSDYLFAPSHPNRPYLSGCRNVGIAKYSSPNPNPAPPPDMQGLDISSEDLQKLQAEDGTLTRACKVANPA